ncbi:MAG: sugar ABC transporter permease [Pseudomonadota bacterium]
MGPLARREARLAYSMLIPTFLIVLAVVLFPLLANFWISVKPVELADLRPPRVIVNEQLRPKPKEAGEEVVVRYRIRNSSQKADITGVTFEDRVPAGLTITGADPRCQIDGDLIACDLGDLSAKAREEIKIPITVAQAYLDGGVRPRDSKAVTTGSAPNVLTSFEFTVANFTKIFNGAEFWQVLRVSIYYTVFGTVGALVLGLFAAQLLNISFRGRNVLRGLFLFPYVAPVIAVAFAWVLLLDAGPGGTFNAMLMQMGATDGPINFLGQREVAFSVLGLELTFPVALTTVIVFEAWRYFPLSFLFILARPAGISSSNENSRSTPELFANTSNV